MVPPTGSEPELQGAFHEILHLRLVVHPPAVANGRPAGDKHFVLRVAKTRDLANPLKDFSREPLFEHSILSRHSVPPSNFGVLDRAPRRRDWNQFGWSIQTRHRLREPGAHLESAAVGSEVYRKSSHGRS